jgi:hypothetical protein
MTTTTTLPPCPRCGSAEAIPIVYGYPTPEAFEASERGEFRLGGCVIGPESPEFECAGCGAELPWATPG